MFKIKKCKHDYKPHQFVRCEHDDYGNTAEIGMSLCAGIEVKRFYVRLGYDRSFNGCIYNAATITFGYRF